MSEFTYLFRGGQTNPSPEQRRSQMEKWVAWFKELGANGHIPDPHHPPGHTLEATGKVVEGNRKVVTDGPYAKSKDIVGGYILAKADDLAQAVAISKGCPILETGGSVEVRPIQIVNM